MAQIRVNPPFLSGEISRARDPKGLVSPSIGETGAKAHPGVSPVVDWLFKYHLTNARRYYQN